jgi:ribose-phosphate pyrophosphokinase
MNTPEWKDLSKYHLPVAPLGIIAPPGSRQLGELVNSHLVTQRRDALETIPMFSEVPGLMRDSFLVPCDCPRFANGEGKGIIYETVRGSDIYLLSDVGNYSHTFKLFGKDCPMTPDEHFQDIKRLIAAIGGRARRITVITPLLYEGRQHRRQSRESLDCAVALQELEHLGVDNIITFDAHDPRVQNAIPLTGFNNLYPTYQIIRALIETEQGLEINRSKMAVVSPDEGAMGRSVYYASILGVDANMFYKRRDFTQIVNGKNPIVQHEFLGENVAGKDMLIVDDLLASGESVLDIARELKRRKAKRIFVAVTFAMFTEGLADYNAAFKDGIINRLYATNLTHNPPELLAAPWFHLVDMSEFIAYLIDLLNHDQSISALFDASRKIGDFLKKVQG